MRRNIRQKRRLRTFGTRTNQRIKERFKRPFPRVVVPSFFTLMNLFCGFAAIIQIYEGQLVYGAWLIVFAGLFDALDGFMARLTNGDSEFGMELDSICDVVSFGAAPGFLIYVYAFAEMDAIGMLIVAALPPLCGAVRLARFNVETRIEESQNNFRGLPIPAMAIMLVAFFLTFYPRPDFFDIFAYGVNSVLIPAVIVLSLLMVSTFPFDKVPRFNKAYMRQNRLKVWLFIIYALLIIFLKQYGLIIVFTIYIARGLVMAGIRFWNDVMSDEDELQAV